MTIAPATLSIRIARCERGWASTFVPPAGAPIARLLRGKRPEEAAVLVPRLFSLCGAAQEAAIRSAFGLPVPAHWDKFAQAWFNSNYGTYFANSTLVVVAAVAILTVIGAMAA
ncbi:MAG TPA: hypothetical protein PLE50_12430, partial [Rhabdaerophilum sp.]|nr:hypothetical protein [Rhabdaerophilum sp.]